MGWEHPILKLGHKLPIKGCPLPVYTLSKGCSHTLAKGLHGESVIPNTAFHYFLCNSFVFYQWNTIGASSVSKVEHCRVMVGVYCKSKCASSKQSCCFFRFALVHSCYSWGEVKMLFIFNQVLHYWCSPSSGFWLLSLPFQSHVPLLQTMGFCWPVNRNNLTPSHGFFLCCLS